MAATNMVLTATLLLFPLTFTSGQGYPARSELTIVEPLDGKQIGPFTGQHADFGSDLSTSSTYTATLLLPPSDPQLCSFPEELKNLTSGDLEVINRRPVALFVSRGNCSFDDKARVALQIQNKLLSNLQFIFVHNNDRDRPNDLLIMSTSSDAESRIELRSMTFIFFTTNNGEALARIITRTAEETGKSPYLGHRDNVGWALAALLTGADDPVRTNSASRTARETFSWLRFVLFSLLIISPCVRALYLWYSAGGRVMLERNERGRVTGFLYVRPMPYWFTSGPPASEEEAPRNHNLTEDEVMALPEITYRSPRKRPENGSDTETDDTDASLTDSKEEEETKESSEHEPVEFKKEETNPTDFKPRTAHKTKPVGDASELTTSSTMCSICIEDFEDGEKIRVLPRCRHGYHLECLKPWLIDRKGCCPLCNTPVLGNGGEDNEGDGEGTDNNNDRSVASSNESTTVHDCPA